MAWGTIIAIYLFVAGVSGGAYLTSVVISKYWQKDLLELKKIGVYLSAPIMMLGLALLIVDAEAGLHAPWRFMYLLSNPTSVMSIGTAIISVFTLTSLLSTLLLYKGKKIPKYLENLGGVFAVGTMVYTGFLIGVISAVPLWNTTILPVLFFVSAFSSGIAATVLVGVLLGKVKHSVLFPIKKIHFSLLVVEVFLIFTLLYMSSSASAEAQASVQRIISGDLKSLFWFGLILLGLALPLAIEAYELKTGHRSLGAVLSTGIAVGGQNGSLSTPTYAKGEHSVSSVGKGLTILAESAVLVGGYTLRYIILAAGVVTILW